MKKLLSALFLGTVAISLSACSSEEDLARDIVIPASQIQDFAPNDTIYYFWSETCPFCRDVNDYMEANDILSNYRIYKFETNNNPDFSKRLTDLSENYQVDQSGVPIIFFGDQYRVGYPPIMEAFDSGTLDSYKLEDSGEE